MSEQVPNELTAAGEPQEPNEVLTPDAILQPGEGQEGRGVNADEAYPGLDAVRLRGARRWRGGGRGRSGATQNTEKNRERGRDR
ncbi:MAG TPA: hypothetical protein VG497_33680 [Kribbella sp.]|nr:hypothetical protein [Kribbella sp.]